MTATQFRQKFTRVRLIALFTVLALGGAVSHAEDQTVASVSKASTPIHVRHLLGFEGVRRKIGGSLMVEGDSLRFLVKGELTPIDLNLDAIKNAEVGSEDRQVGGVPLVIGKAAVPFQGGRAVSLLSRKKFDTLTLEYTDPNGGFHGTIFELRKGKAQTVRNQLLARGVRPASAIIATQPEIPEHPSSTNGRSGRCCVQVEMVDVAGDLRVEPAFRVAIYENLLNEIANSKVFSEVLRSGDRNATSVSDLLILKTTVSKYSPGSETLRSLTTIAGATKITLHMQVYTQGGFLLLDHEVSGNVRFFGENLRATNHLAHNVAKAIKHDVAASGNK